MIIVEEVQPAGLGLSCKIGKSTRSLFPGRSAAVVMEDARPTEVASLPWHCPREVSSDKETNFYYLRTLPGSGSGSSEPVLVCVR